MLWADKTPSNLSNLCRVYLTSQSFIHLAPLQSLLWKTLKDAVSAVLSSGDKLEGVLSAHSMACYITPPGQVLNGICFVTCIHGNRIYLLAIRKSLWSNESFFQNHYYENPESSWPLWSNKSFLQMTAMKIQKAVGHFGPRELFANDHYENPECSWPLWSKRAFSFANDRYENPESSWPLWSNKSFLQMTAMQIQKAVGHFGPRELFANDHYENPECSWPLWSNHANLKTH